MPFAKVYDDDYDEVKNHFQAFRLIVYKVRATILFLLTNQHSLWWPLDSWYMKTGVNFDYC